MVGSPAARATRPEYSLEDGGSFLGAVLGGLETVNTSGEVCGHGGWLRMGLAYAMLLCLKTALGCWKNYLPQSVHVLAATAVDFILKPKET
jgi:hypothetical protein